MPRSDQTRIPAAFIRGGSSKAIFLHDRDIPPPGELRDKVLKRIMGTPDPIQIDGMGGSKAVTSKMAIITPSEREEEADVDYEFVQVGVQDDIIDYSGNCGNISSAVGPFAIDEGLVKTFREGRSFDELSNSKTTRTQEIRIYNTGTEKVLVAHCPVDEEGYSITSGDFEMAAVPGNGAPILLDFRETVGASQNSGLLPTRNVVDYIDLRNNRQVAITICDVGNICIFALASDFGITGHETAASLTENKELIASVKELRGKAAYLLAMCHDWAKVDEESPFMPMPVLIAPPPPPPLAEDEDGSGSHVSGRLFLDNMCHESMAGTGAVCFAAASRVRGSVVHQLLQRQVGDEEQVWKHNNVFKIAHPLGVMPVAVEIEGGEGPSRDPKFKTLSIVRTSRRLMDGGVYVPKSVRDPASEPPSEPPEEKEREARMGIMLEVRR